MNPLSQQMQAQGRGNDSVLVHMTPREVGGLQALAKSAGGSLTVNPQTGLPEAGFLDSILPMVAGAILTPLTGGLINPFTASLLVGGGTALATGNIGKGLMAGLGAYGGAGLGSALGLGGASAAAGAGGAGGSGGFLGNLFGSGSSAAGGAGGAAGSSGSSGLFGGLFGGAPAAGAEAGGALAGETANATAMRLAQTQGMGAANAFTSGAAPAAAGGLGGMSTMGMVGLGLPLLGALSGSENSSAPPTPEKPTVSLSPVQSLNRKVQFPVNRDPYDSSEFQYFTPVGGSPSTVTQLKPTMTMAKGGNVNLENGAFIVDARTVSEMGNGSSSAGQEVLARMGGRPIQGPGDGVSDSIHANIGGKQEARVARDEVKFSPDAVQRVGGGSAQKGAQRLYALMHKAQQARKKAKRGEDTGLAALVGR
jgi:hypothetical protein